MKLIFLFALLSFTSSHLFASPDHSKHNNSRPLINLENIRPDSFEKGMIRVKLQPAIAEHLKNELREWGHGHRGIQSGDAQFDMLCIQTDIESYSSSIDIDYQTHIKSRLNEEKHIEWGFHQWFDLKFGTGTDIIQIVKQLEALDAVIIAEPVYKKVHHSNNNNTQGHSEKTDSYSERSGLEWLPDDPLLPSQWNYNNTGQSGGTAGADIQMTDAWEIERGNEQLIVAVIDGGIEFCHSDLSGSSWDQLGFNFVNNTPDIIPHQHGTQIAGIIAAATNNANGIAGIAGGSGLNDGVRLMSCQVFTHTDAGGFHTAFLWAADHGAAIANNSWSYNTPGVYENLTLDAIDYFNNNGGGNVMDGGITIFSAGNFNCEDQYFPSCYEGTIAVAASNHADIKAYYSNYGDWVSITAPGGETNVDVSQGIRSTFINNSYQFSQGTSTAAPQVSGVAALIVSYALRNNAILHNSDLIEILLSSTDNHYGLNPTYLNKLGTGRLNAYNALLSAQSFIGEVKNPAEFTATTFGTDQIHLEWQKNDDADDVMVVYSSNNEIGQPLDQIQYEINQALPNGGTVLYIGQANACFHTGLEAGSRYHYKIFSVTDQFKYSLGRYTIGTTNCEIKSVPFYEDFNGDEESLLCWEVVDHLHNGRQAWQFGTMMGGLNGTIGNYAFMNSSECGYGQNQHTDLISPEFDFTGVSNITLGFSHYYRHRQGNSASVWYTADEGENWVLIQDWNSSTANPSTFGVTISELDNTEHVRFKWTYEGGSGFSWSVDDISIEGEICSSPHSLSVMGIDESAATITWLAGSSETIWDIAWGIEGFDPDHGGYHSQGLENNEFTIHDLEPNHNYHVYLRASCSEFTYSVWSEPLMFQTSATVLPGDANCNGIVDILDVILMTNYILGIPPETFCPENADLNQDGIIDILDVSAAINIIIGGKTGHPQNSASAKLVLNHESVILESVGNITVLEFEIRFNSLDKISVHHDISEFQLFYSQTDQTLKGILISLNNTPLSHGTVKLLEIEGGNQLDWISAKASDPEAGAVEVTTVKNATEKFSIYPNPAQDKFNLAFQLETAAIVDFTLMNLKGQNIETIGQNLSLEQGSHRLSFQIYSEIPPGLYLIKMKSQPHNFPGKYHESVSKIVLVE